MNKLKIISIENTVHQDNYKPVCYYTSQGRKLSLNNYKEFMQFSDHFLGTFLLYYLCNPEVERDMKIKVLYYNSVEVREEVAREILGECADLTELTRGDLVTLVNDDDHRNCTLTNNEVERTLQKANDKIGSYFEEKGKNDDGFERRDIGQKIEFALGEDDLFTYLNLAYVIKENPNRIENLFSIQDMCAMHVYFWDRVLFCLEEQNSEGLINVWSQRDLLGKFIPMTELEFVNYKFRKKRKDAKQNRAARYPLNEAKTKKYALYPEYAGLETRALTNKLLEDKIIEPEGNIVPTKSTIDKWIKAVKDR